MTDSMERERLERQANLARARLVTTIDALDRRAHEAVDVKLQLRRHRTALFVMAGVVLAPLVGAIAFSVYRSATNDRRRRKERVRALERSWRHPERVARYKNSPLAMEIGRKLLVGTITVVAMSIVKRVVDGRMRPNASR